MSGLLPPSSRLTFFSRPPASCADAPPDLGRAGEDTTGDVRVGDQRLAGLGVADDDLQQAVGQAGLLEDGREHRAADDRRLRIRLEHDGVAERQGRRDDAHAEHATASSTA